MDEPEVRDLRGGANQSGVRAHNERLLLSMLQRHGAMPGADLARALVLGPGARVLFPCAQAAREDLERELARRGIEYILTVYAPEADANRDWQPPMPRDLGWKGLSHAEIKAEAQLTNTEIRLTRRSKP